MRSNTSAVFQRSRFLITPKTGVTRAHRYDPDMNPTYYNFALHCGFGIVPARPHKPRDKVKVENAVQVAQRWIVAALRNRKFFSLEELNVVIRELLNKLNHRPFRKKDGTRKTVWEAIDKPALKPLPMEPFDLSEWSRARVNIDYHVTFDANFYSVPYNLCMSWLRFVRRQPRQKSCTKHARCFALAQPRTWAGVTNEEHRPRESSCALGMDTSRMVRLAETIGPNTARLFERIMHDKPHPEMGYRGCLGIIRLAERYSAQRVEAASERALLTGACRYKSIELILRNSLDQVPLSSLPHVSTPPSDRGRLRSRTTSTSPASSTQRRIRPGRRCNLEPRKRRLPRTYQMRLTSWLSASSELQLSHSPKTVHREFAIR